MLNPMSETLVAGEIEVTIVPDLNEPCGLPNAEVRIGGRVVATMFYALHTSSGTFVWWWADAPENTGSFPLGRTPKEAAGRVLGLLGYLE